MNNRELIQFVAAAAGLKNLEAGRAVRAVSEAIGLTLRKGGSVVVSGVGNFGVGKRAARKGRNPRTGEEINIRAAKVPRFKACAALKDKLN